MQIATSKTQMQSSQSKPPDPREFIRLLVENERRIFAYIRTLLGNSTDAEDVLQETSITMWDKFSEFDQEVAAEDLGKSFIAWSFKIAYFTSQNFRRKQGRSKVVFSDSTFEAIAKKTSQMTERLDQRHRWLQRCIEKLSQPDRDLLKMRYELDSSIDSTAEESGRTKTAVYKALSRMRSTLFECVNQGMSLENQS
jgi:RNA polymerase sigma-70 factor (ECF subfamily)